MVLTKVKQQEAYAHIIKTVLERDETSPLYLALQQEGCDNIYSLLNLTQDDVSHFSYKKSENDPMTHHLRRGDIILLGMFISYYRSRMQSDDPITDANWTSITLDDFNTYRMRQPLPPPPSTGSSPSKQLTPAEQFRRGIKCDPSLFPKLKDERFNDSWHRTFINQARAQGVENVLDSSFKPQDADTIALFNEQQKYVYAVLESTVHTDHGKAIVRSHQDSYDAQAAYAELMTHHLQSTKAAMSASELLSYITSARLGPTGTWKGTTEAFILHWQEQVRLYERMVQPSDHFSDTQKRHMLENAVRPVSGLHSVQTTADLDTTRTGKRLSFPQYTSLLLAAATTHDKLSHGTNNRRRTVLLHDVDYDPGPSYSDYDIDAAIDTIQVHATQSRPTRPPRPPPDPSTRVPGDRWTQLSNDARKAWRSLSPADRAILLGNPPPSQCQPT